MAEAALLAIDTCGTNGTVALAAVRDAGIASLGQTELHGRAASSELMPAIDRLLRESSLNVRALAAIVVVSGPGSFTGERIGLSTAKGLAHATGTPLIALSRLAILAGLAPEQDSLTLLDAGRSEFYARRASREWLASLAEIEAAVRAGEHLLVAEPALVERLADWQPRLAGPLDALAAARAALTRFNTGDFDDLASLDANYLRRSDAELFVRPAAAKAK